MAKKQLTISIPIPCTEDWNNMTPNQSGKFCASCQKTVVDFSRMSDAEIFNYFANFSGDTCGRFTEKQLTAPLNAPMIGKPQNRWAWALSALLLPTLAASQTAKRNAPTEIVTPSVFEQKKSEKSLKIEGQVAELGTHVVQVNAFVSIAVDVKTIVTTTTDEKGFFSINLPKELENQAFNIVVTSKGMEKQVINFQHIAEVLNSRLFITLEKTKSIKLSGTVVDAGAGDTLVGVAVVLHGSTKGTLTDLDGHFELEVSSEEIDSAAYKIAASYLGYTTEVITIDLESFKANKDLRIGLKAQFLGEVVVGYVTSYKKSNLFQRTKFKIRNFFRRLRNN
jgi:CarboxypepD_reg-like domain